MPGETKLFPLYGMMLFQCYLWPETVIPELFIETFGLNAQVKFIKLVTYFFPNHECFVGVS